MFSDTISSLSSLDCGSFNRRVLQTGEQFTCEITLRSSGNEVLVPPPQLSLTTDQMALSSSGDTSAVTALTYAIRLSPTSNVLLVTGTAAAAAARATFSIHVKVGGVEIAGSPASFAVNCTSLIALFPCCSPSFAWLCWPAIEFEFIARFPSLYSSCYRLRVSDGGRQRRCFLFRRRRAQLQHQRSRPSAVLSHFSQDRHSLLHCAQRTQNPHALIQLSAPFSFLLSFDSDF